MAGQAKQITTMNRISLGHILIASSGSDLSVDGVVQELTARGYTPIVFETDKVVNQSKHLLTQLDTKGTLTLSYQGLTFKPSDVGALWYRRPNDLYDIEPRDPLRRFHLQSNVRALLDGIFAAFPDKAWLNEPHAMRKAELKMHQLMLASSVGFTIPATTLSNDWDDIRRVSSKKIIAKIPYPLFEQNDRKTKVLYTTILDNKESALPTHATPFPAIWQPFIPKRREWRVTVVGSRIFAATIYTSDEAKNDWREHQRARNKVEFRAEEFPKDLQKKCLVLLKKMGLRFGAFDFIETPDGEIIFLEVNTNGQYGWIEDTLGLKISAAIASELIAIASRHKPAKS